MVSSDWLFQWKCFISNKISGSSQFSQEQKDRVRQSSNKDIGILPPLPICNDDLFLIRNSNVKNDDLLKNEEYEVTAGALERNKRVLKKDLQLNKHYRGVNHEVWHLLHKIYGGGPIVIREELDIYAADVNVQYQAIVKKQKYK